MRVWAYCRSSSRSNAGRVPLVDVNLSRASRTRCAEARRLLGVAIGGSAGSWTTSGLSAALLIKQHKPHPQLAGFLCIAYLWQQILKSCLKELRNLLNGSLNR